RCRSPHLPDSAERLQGGRLLRRPQQDYPAATVVEYCSAVLNPALSSRLNQILVPLLSIIEDASVRADIKASARSLERTHAQERATLPEAYLLEVLSELLADQCRKAVPLTEIAIVFAARVGPDFERPVTARYLGSLLRTRLHLTSYKTQGVYVVPIVEKAKVDALCPRYGVTPYARSP
ncbi:hypothetical protein Q4610_13680, partial [Sphingobium sp. HBC34]